MKHILALLTAVALMATLSACNKKPDDTDTVTTTTTSTTAVTTTTTVETTDSTADASSGETTSTVLNGTTGTTVSTASSSAAATTDKTVSTSQTGSTTTDKAVGIADTAWNLTYQDDYNNVHCYVLNFKSKKLRYDTAVLWSEVFTAEDWAKTKEKKPTSVLVFNNKEYYIDISVTYNITCNVTEDGANLTYRLGNDTAIKQRFVLENGNTLKIVADDNPYGSLVGYAYTPQP